ncbi:MAG: FAD-dependent oxidoreductase [Verrucomicrobiales bacterium]|nr:FAD-dependent oxidoreductase [Verrucomicrobiales bacterium]
MPSTSVPSHLALLLSLHLLLLIPCGAFAADLEADLLIVGGNESACAAAVQAGRLGVKNIVLVNDIDWLGGQFSAEGVGCLDEWTVVQGKRTHFPRSGLFLEVIQRIRAHNSAKYGLPCPGNAFCGTETIEPAAAAQIFEDLLKPAVDSGALRILRGWEPAKVEVQDGAVRAVTFQKQAEALTIHAKLTIDASDWGDVIRLSGAKYGAGPDLKSRFGEESAPEAFDDAGIQEMNPLSYCVVLRETQGKDATVPRPTSYDARSFAALDKLAPWVDSDMSAGIYSPSGNSPYTHRRLVDRWHNGLTPGTEATFINYPVQDYPICQLPQRVVEALEESEPGASKKNIVDLSPAQRRIIFADAKQHALGVLHHLQTAVHDRVGDFPQSFRYMALTDEFGTADRLPPKPYVREGLRLEALYMLREQDIRTTSKEPLWARVLPTDAIFAFQFNIDFHPTRRKFLTEDRNDPWQYIHTASRGWHTDTDRAVFPLRGLVPATMDGLLGAGKNIGVSSVVQSALRLHGQMMHVGQAVATLAWMALGENTTPRALVDDLAKVRALQSELVRGHGGPGILLWPWQDVSPDALYFEAVNLLSVRGIWQPKADDVFFHPDQPMQRRELARVLATLCRALPDAKPWPEPEMPLYTDVPANDPDRAFIEAMVSWGDFQPLAGQFRPDQVATWSTLHSWMTRSGLAPSAGLIDSKDRANLPLSRAEAAIQLWRALKQQGEWTPPAEQWQKDLRAGDALPLDQDNNNLLDRLEPTHQ